MNIAFLAEPLDDRSGEKIRVFANDIDFFHIHQSEVFWLCRKKQSESTFSIAVLEKTLGLRSTMRGAKTIYKLAEKYLPMP